MTETYERLVEDLVRHLETSQGGQRWIALAGGPGAGKSTLAARVAASVNEQVQQDVVVVLPMDGFHYSRAQLKAMGEQNGEVGPTFEDLIARRGSPWTFDAHALCAALSAARQAGEYSLPTYSRQLSDPVPEGVELKKNHRIVLVEGNYLLLYQDPLWAPLKSLFDQRWFIKCESLDAQRSRVAIRHLQTWTIEKERMWGKGIEGATAKVDTSDFLNMQLVNTTACYADRIICSTEG